MHILLQNKDNSNFKKEAWIKQVFSKWSINRSNWKKLKDYKEKNKETINYTIKTLDLYTQHIYK